MVPLGGVTLTDAMKPWRAMHSNVHLPEETVRESAILLRVQLPDRKVGSNLRLTDVAPGGWPDGAALQQTQERIVHLQSPSSLRHGGSSSGRLLELSLYKSGAR